MTLARASPNAAACDMAAQIDVLGRLLHIYLWPL
jgi:hypothetical protein